jgi:hypothetical protein
MMRKNDALPSKYLNATDVGNGTFKLTVVSIVMEKMENDGAMKPVMSFQGAQKSMPINATNWDNMAVVYGDESDNWIGKQVEMYTEATRMPNGTPTRGVRIRPVAGADTATAMQAQAPLGQNSGPPVTTGEEMGPQPGNMPGGPGEQAAVAAQPMATDPTDLSDPIPF